MSQNILVNKVRIKLPPIDAAYVQMVLEEHAALVSMADKKRDARMAPVLIEHGIPKGVIVNRVPTDDGTAELVYEAPA